VSRTLLVAALALTLSLETASAQDRTAQARDSTQARDSAQATPSAAQALRPSLPPWLLTPSLLKPGPGTLSSDSSVWALQRDIAPQFDGSCFGMDLAAAFSIRLGCGEYSYCESYMTGLYEARHGEISVWADMLALVLDILAEDWLGDTDPLFAGPSGWRFPNPP
jgi:hypothetical protein